MSADLRGRDFLKEIDLSVEEWHTLLDLAGRLKAGRRDTGRQRHLDGRNIALFFERASTRTRWASEVAAHEEGAQVTYFDGVGQPTAREESVADTARVLSRLYDGIEYHGFDQRTVETIARYADVPVWNGLTDQWHPTQSLADMLTMLEHARKPADQVCFAYLGDARSSVACSLMVAGAMMGMQVRMVAPEALEPPCEVAAAARTIAAATGARIQQTREIGPGVEGVDFVYADAWLPAGASESLWRARLDLLSPYRVDRALLERTGNPEVRFMHRLPSVHGGDTALARRLLRRTGGGGAEVTEEVFESRHSIVFDQAENRLHTIKAVLVATLAA